MKKYAFPPKAPAVVLVVLIALAAAAAASAQTALQAQLVSRAVTTDDISIYKLPAGTMKSGGLTTIGLGQPAYLDALINIAVPAADIGGVVWTLTSKPDGSNAALADSPLGANVPVYEPSERLVSQVAGRKVLRPDVPGLYTVKATITTASASADVAITITGAKYVGAKACSTCHSGALGPNMAASWQKTAHATIFKDGMNGVASDHYSASCLICHTVGYEGDPKISNGGFSDVAAQLKWTFPTTVKAGTYDAVPEALKNVGGIQCENCHGPGSVHASTANKRAISASFGSGDCGQCHNAGTHHVKTAEWNNSMHAVTTRDPSGAGREGCVGCHTGTGFMGKIRGATTVDTTYAPINCQSCHEPHGQTKPGSAAHLVRAMTNLPLMDGTWVLDAGAGALCMNCHQSRREAATYVETTPGSAHFGPHSGPQADMLMGVNAINYGRNIPSSAHGAVVEDTCANCHMQAVAATDKALFKVGGHTFKTSFTDGGVKTELVAACQKCHGPMIDTFDFPLFDYDGDGAIDGVQTEVQHLLDKLALLLPPAGKAKTDLTIDSTWTTQQLRAAYNYLFVKNDGSRGVHNMAYTVGLLKASIADLTPKK